MRDGWSVGETGGNLTGARRAGRLLMTSIAIAALWPTSAWAGPKAAPAAASDAALQASPAAITIWPAQAAVVASASDRLTRTPDPADRHDMIFRIGRFTVDSTPGYTNRDFDPLARADIVVAFHHHF